MKTTVKNNKMSIHTLINANAKAKRFNAKEASKYYKNFKHICLSVEGRILQKSEKTAIQGVAIEKHNKLDNEQRTNKAVVLCLNGLKNGKLPFKTTKNEIIACIKVMSVNGDLEKCEQLTSYNMDKLYRTLDRTIVRLRKLNRK